MDIAFEHSSVEKEKRLASKKQLLWLAMASISMFFAALLSALIVEKGDVNSWEGLSLPDYFIYSTLIIVFSSVLLLFYKRQIKHGKKVFNIFSFVFILGLFFTYFQLKGWKYLLDDGVYFLGSNWNKAGGYLFVLTLAHLLHLFGGLIAVLVSIIKLKRNLYSRSNYLGLELTSTYWHYLTILWIVLFFFLDSMAT